MENDRIHKFPYLNNLINENHYLYFIPRFDIQLKQTDELINVLIDENNI